MIVDDALTETEAILLDAALADDLPDGIELPDRALQILHNLLDPSEYAEVVDDDGVTKAGNPGPLRRYWTSGKGGADIGWGSEGDFMRCVARVSKYMDIEDAKGYCNLRHKEATGVYPGQHGKRKTRKAIVVVEDIVKHLGGRHDQKTHGRGGGVDDATLQRFSDLWIGTDRSPQQIEDIRGAFAAITADGPSDADYWPKGDFEGRTHVADEGAMFDATRVMAAEVLPAAKPSEEALYRGLHVPAGTEFTPGMEFREGLASWTPDRGTADDFAAGRYSTTPFGVVGAKPGHEPVIMRVEGLPSVPLVRHHSNPDSAGEGIRKGDERLATGIFRVTSVTREGGQTIVDVKHVGLGYDPARAARTRFVDGQVIRSGRSRPAPLTGAGSQRMRHPGGAQMALAGMYREGKISGTVYRAVLRRQIDIAYRERPDLPPGWRNRALQQADALISQVGKAVGADRMSLDVIPDAELLAMVAEEESKVAKHLPGKHDQSSHGRKGGGEHYVPMAPDRSEWPSNLENSWEALASSPTPLTDGNAIMRVQAAAYVHGKNSGMTDDEAATYAVGVARSGVAEGVRRQMPLDSHEQAAFNEKLNRYREEGRVCIAMDEDALDGMRNDGRYMTQFETGYSGGAFNPQERAAAEVELFNHHPNVPVEKRTAYGFVSLPGMESQLGVSQYGSVRVVLKPDVADRTTMVVGDSLSTMAKPVPLKGPADYDLDQQARGYPAVSPVHSGRTFAAYDPPDFVQDDYVEAQIHGGVKWSDVAEVHLPTSGGRLDDEYDGGWLADLAQGGVKVIGYDVNDADSGYFPDYVEKATGVLVATRRDGARLYRVDERTGYIETDRRRYAPRPLMALEARGGWISATTARVVVEKHLPGRHDQQSHAGGRFGTHTGMRVGDTKDDAKAAANLLDDPTRMENLPEELQARMLSSAAEIGATPESLEAHIEESLAKAGGPGADGHDWYEKAHGECQSIADDTGLTIDQATGAVAAISPQMAWGPNLAVARFAAENRDEMVDVAALSTPMTRRLGKGKGTGTMTAYEWAVTEVDGKNLDKQRRHMPPLAELEGKRFSDLDPYVAATLLKAHAQQGIGVFNGKRLTGPLSIADDVTGKMQRVNFPPTIQTGRGLRIMVEGGNGNNLLNGHKVRSFRNNLRNPLDPRGDITVDSHAVSLALGRKVSSGSEEYTAFTGGRKRLPDGTMSKLTPGPTSDTLGVKGNYALWADAYRRVAKRHGLRPNQLQSITWIQWRREHPDWARTTHAMD